MSTNICFSKRLHTSPHSLYVPELCTRIINITWAGINNRDCSCERYLLWKVKISIHTQFWNVTYDCVYLSILNHVFQALHHFVLMKNLCLVISHKRYFMYMIPSSQTTVLSPHTLRWWRDDGENRWEAPVGNWRWNNVRIS